MGAIANKFSPRHSTTTERLFISVLILSRAIPAPTALVSRWSRATPSPRTRMQLLSRIYSATVLLIELLLSLVTQTSGRRQSTILLRQMERVFRVRATPRVEHFLLATLDVGDTSCWATCLMQQLNTTLSSNNFINFFFDHEFTNFGRSTVKPRAHWQTSCGDNV